MSDPDNSYYLAFRVVCVGDVNAADIAQAVREQILNDFGCVKGAECLRHRRGVPRADTWGGVYLDSSGPATAD
jgi:hypothetical protein